MKLYGGGWSEFARLSTIDSDARRAMLAYNRAKTIALSAYKKLQVLESLLKQHVKDRVIIFTENNDFVYQISEKHLIPVITHQTKTKERKRILERFNRGTVEKNLIYELDLLCSDEIRRIPKHDVKYCYKQENEDKVKANIQFDEAIKSQGLQPITLAKSVIEFQKSC